MLRQPLHRLFFAIRPPWPLAQDIYQSSAWFGPGRRVHADHLHVTLDILDDYPVLPRMAVDRMIEVAESIAAEPFRIIFDRVVASPYSVALRPSEPIPALDLFQRRLRAALADAGLTPRAGWRFSPHLTLLYRDGPPFAEAIDPVSWRTEEFLLVHSVVGETKHLVLGRWALRPVLASCRVG